MSSNNRGNHFRRRITQYIYRQVDMHCYRCGCYIPEDPKVRRPFCLGCQEIMDNYYTLNPDEIKPMVVRYYAESGI